MLRKTTVQTFSWRGVACQLAHTQNHINAGWSQLVLSSTALGGPPLSLGDGKRWSHELDEDELVAAGGAAAFVLQKLEDAARYESYRRRLASWQQLRLL